MNLRKSTFQLNNFYRSLPKKLQVFFRAENDNDNCCG